MPLISLLIVYHGGDVIILKLESAFIIWGLEYVGRSVMWVEGKWSRHWSSWGCTESKRTDILCDLNLQQKIQYPIKCFVPNKSFYLDKIFHIKDTKIVACPVKANEIKQTKIK